MVPGEGIEPPAFGLQNRCTTAVLTRHIQRFIGCSRSSVDCLSTSLPPRLPAQIDATLLLLQLRAGGIKLAIRDDIELNVDVGKRFPLPCRRAGRSAALARAVKARCHRSACVQSERLGLVRELLLLTKTTEPLGKSNGWGPHDSSGRAIA